MPTIRWHTMKEEFTHIKETLSQTKKYPGLLPFLIANFLYCDAVNTVIAFMAVYAHQVAGFDDAMIRNLLIVSTVFAAIGSLIFGWLTDRWGAKRTLTTVLYLWIVTLVAAIASFSSWTFWLVGFLVGCALGGTWVSARALVLDLSPPGKIGEIYGLYNMGGKFGFILGPLVWGFVVLVFEDLNTLKYRIAVGSLLLFLLAGLYLLKKVPDKIT